MSTKGWIILIFALMFAGGVLTSYAEYKFKYNLYETILEKIFRKKVHIAIVVLFLFGCGVRGYHMAGGTGDLTHAPEPGARVVVPNSQNFVQQAAPVKETVIGGCDESLWKHVYNPQRLEVQQRCVSVTGIAVDATHGKKKDGVRHEGDGDPHAWLKLDPGQEKYLNAGNMSDEEGNLVYEIPCTFKVTQKDAIAACNGYKATVKIPPMGAHVRITGAWVKDDNHARWFEIHPVSSIEILSVKK